MLDMIHHDRALSTMCQIFLFFFASFYLSCVRLAPGDISIMCQMQKQPAHMHVHSSVFLPPPLHHAITVDCLRPSDSPLDILRHVPNHEILALGHLDREAGQLPAECRADALGGADRHECHVGGDFLVDV